VLFNPLCWRGESPPSDTHARVSTGGFSLVVGGLALAKMLGLFLPVLLNNSQMESIIKSEYIAAIALIAAAIGILAIIVVLVFATP
jgi:hypothetical protein